eukprot:169014_1
MSTDEIIDEKKVDEDSHNDYQEVIINPGNDRRIIVCDTQNKSDGIIECIGCLEVHYIPDPTINAPELAHGTGTVIHIDNHHCIFVLTAAHNIYANEKECINCKAKTLKKKCSHCKSGNTIKTGKLIKPTDIYFVRRSNDKHTLGESIERYQAENYEVPDKYLTYSLPRDGHDIAFIMFKCHDKDGINLYTEQCKKICLISDTMFGGSSCVSYIYGYPGEFRETKNKRIYYYLYGMGTSKIDPNGRFKIARNDQNKMYIINKCVDTTYGQSGSCIYYNDFDLMHVIYGVHCGGSKKLFSNFATFFDEENMNWMKNVFQIKNVKSITKFFNGTRFEWIDRNLKLFAKDTLKCVFVLRGKHPQMVLFDVYPEYMDDAVVIVDMVYTQKQQSRQNVVRVMGKTRQYIDDGEVEQKQYHVNKSLKDIIVFCIDYQQKNPLYDMYVNNSRKFMIELCSHVGVQRSDALIAEKLFYKISAYFK